MSIPGITGPSGEQDLPLAATNTARGPIDTAQLGVTLMHEHVFLLSPEIMQNYPESWGDEAQREADAVRRMDHGNSAASECDERPKSQQHCVESDDENCSANGSASRDVGVQPETQGSCRKWHQHKPKGNGAQNVGGKGLHE